MGYCGKLSGERGSALLAEREEENKNYAQRIVTVPVLSIHSFSYVRLHFPEPILSYLTPNVAYFDLAECALKANFWWKLL